MRITQNFNEDWRFHLGDQPDFAAAALDDSAWQPLRLPHDWSTQFEPDETAPTGGGGGFAVAGVDWYRKRFTAPVETERRTGILFEGIYMDSTVYLNGEKVGGHGYGYSSFLVDLTGKLQPGENVLAVRVDNSHQPNSRWYSGSGIYRNVWLVQTAQVHFDLWGLRCCTNEIYFEMDEAALQIRSMLCNESDKTAHTGVVHRLYTAEGELVSTSGTALQLAPHETSDCMVRHTVAHPHLWTDEDPYLYTLVSTVLWDNEPVDELTTRVGIRTATFDCDKGFLLNGNQVKIKGMCVHHDCGLTGAVGYKEIWRRRMIALKDMGCNGLRCSHNPPDPSFLDLCDELGFLVMDEVFDEWLLTKNKTNNYYSQAFAYGSSQYFTRHAEEDLTIMLRRDFNHPSVVIWSIGNEIPEQSSIDGVAILNFLQDICHREDGSRMVTSACDNIAAVENIRTLREFENALDVTGYNYVGRWRERAETFYDADRHDFPKRRMIGTENGSAGGVRGAYEGSGHFGPYYTATMGHEALWRYTVSHDFVAGDYLWTGIDYLGETRWPSRGAACGPIDMAGFRKDTFYYFRSIWNQKEITLHLAPHWNWGGDEGTYKQVVCYTNCDEVELFINGKSVGRRGYSCPRYGVTRAWNERRKRGRDTTNDLHLLWDVAYEPGELKAVGYRDGEAVAEATVATTGAPSKLVVSADATVLRIAGISQIELSTQDKNGAYVPDAACLVHCRIDGPAHLVGMDGGDLSDLSLWAAPQRKMFAGLLLAVIQADAPGDVTVTFSAEGMPDEIVHLKVE